MKRAWNFKCIKVPRLPIQRFGTWSQLLFAKQLGRWPRNRGNALKQSHQQPTMNLRPNIHRPLMAFGIILHICWLNMKHGKKNANCFQFWTHLTTVAIQFASRRHQCLRSAGWNFGKIFSLESMNFCVSRCILHGILGVPIRKNRRVYSTLASSLLRRMFWTEICFST